MTKRTWHVGHWGPLGWAETIIKLVAVVIAVAALATTSADADLGAAAIACVVLLGIATLGILGAVADRIIEREAIAMAFVVVNLVGHASALVLALGLPTTRAAVVAYCLLMATGDLIKIVFLQSERFRVRAVQTSTLIMLTGTYIALYVVAAAFALAV